MKNILDEEKMIVTINKLDIYKKDEELNFDSIGNTLNNLITYYQTGNSELFDAKQFEVTSKFNVLSKIHNNNIFVLNKNLDNYKNTKLVVESVFDNIVE